MYGLIFPVMIFPELFEYGLGARFATASVLHALGLPILLYVSFSPVIAGIEFGQQAEREMRSTTNERMPLIYGSVTAFACGKTAPLWHAAELCCYVCYRRGT